MRCPIGKAAALGAKKKKKKAPLGNLNININLGKRSMLLFTSLFIHDSIWSLKKNRKLCSFF